MRQILLFVVFGIACLCSFAQKPVIAPAGYLFPSDTVRIAPQSPTETPHDIQVFHVHKHATTAEQFFLNAFNIVIKEDGLSSLFLDDSRINQNLFTRIHTTDYFYASIPVDINSSHTVYSENATPFGIIVYGFGHYDSYGYPGGLALADVSMERMVTVTTADPVDITAVAAMDIVVYFQT